MVHCVRLSALIFNINGRYVERWRTENKLRFLIKSQQYRERVLEDRLLDLEDDLRRGSFSVEPTKECRLRYGWLRALAAK